jgi:hypothetical protein
VHEEGSMDINMQEQFLKLEAMISNISKFYFGLKNEYLGPVNPSSIVTFGSRAFKVNAIVIAESVPSLYLPSNLGENRLEAVIAYLNEDFEFQQYHPQINELLGLSVLIGDPEYSYDGTLAGATEFFQEKKWFFMTLYDKTSC